MRRIQTAVLQFKNMQPTLTPLDIGLPVLTVPMPGIESLTVMAVVNTGSRFEHKGKEGIAHFFEHIVFKGTKRYPTAQKLSATIDGLGADFNAFTSHEYTGYYVKAAAKHLHTALDVVSDLLLAPTLRDADVQREKSVIAEEINMYYDSPARYIGDLFGRMVYQGSGLGHDVIGTKETVGGVTAADFRAFLGQWYGLSNMVLVLAGKKSLVEDPKTIAAVREFFSKDSGKRVDKFAVVKPFLTDSKLAKQRLHLEFRDTQQAHFILAWPGIKAQDPDRYTMAVLSSLIGGYMSSRLFLEVREKRGLSYYVHSMTDEFHDKGVMGLAAGVDPARVDEAITVSANEFHKLATGKKKVTKSELTRAQEYLVGKWALSMEDSDAMAQFAGLRKILLDEVSSMQDVMKRIQAVTLSDVQRLAKRLVLPGEARLALIGPYKDQDRFSKLIKDL
jgi:predicted Zn-dependent peptidase